MTLLYKPPVPRGDDWMTWARRLGTYLTATRSSLVQQSGDERAAIDGILMWDRTNAYPVVSSNGTWRQVVLADGYAFFYQDSDITAAAASTAYSITYDDPPMASGIQKDGSNPERLVFTEGGTYLLSFSAQVASTSSSTVEFRFWPRINGTNVTGSTIVANLHQNGASFVVSRSAVFQMSAGDYLEVMWAVDSTSGLLKAEPSTTVAVEGFDSPSTPSSSLSVTRIRA